MQKESKNEAFHTKLDSVPSTCGSCLLATHLRVDDHARDHVISAGRVCARSSCVHPAPMLSVRAKMLLFIKERCCNCHQFEKVVRNALARTTRAFNMNLTT